MTLIHCCPDDMMRFRFAAEPDMKIEASFLPDAPSPRTPDTACERRPARWWTIRRDWAYVTACFHRDVASRMAVVQGRGFGGLLNELSPALTLAGSRLRIDDGRNDEITLSGKGLVLMPSVFWKGTPLLVNEDPAKDVRCLVYSARRPVATSDELEDGLENLVGATRAATLKAVQQPMTTSELAEATGTSLSTASRHAAALRRVGLVDSRRAGKAVRHCLTPLGWTMVTPLTAEKVVKTG